MAVINGDRIIGTEENDSLVGGLGNDSLYGLNGDDILTDVEGDDRLVGGLGRDTLAGGLGEDTYYVDNLEDKIFEVLNLDIDTVKSSVDWVLGSHLENLTLIDNTDAVFGSGNELDNKILGNNADNSLFGGSNGNDSLYGYAGNDDLIGGVGNDRLVGDIGSDSLTGGAGNDILILGKNTTVSNNQNSDSANITIEVNSQISGFENNTIGINSQNSDSNNVTTVSNYQDSDSDTVYYDSGDGTDKIYGFVRGRGGDVIQFQGISNINVVKNGIDTQFFTGESLLVTIRRTTGFTEADVNVNLVSDGDFTF